MNAFERFLGAAYWMRHARSRFRAEKKAKTDHGLSFRQWARRTYNATACAGKLAAMVRR